MISPRAARKLATNAASMLRTLPQVDKHIKVMARLGFTNTSFYIPSKAVGKIMTALTKKGYEPGILTGFNEEVGQTMIEITW